MLIVTLLNGQNKKHLTLKIKCLKSGIPHLISMFLKTLYERNKNNSRGI